MDMQDDCIIEEVTPSKSKKLKQARLQFQTLRSSESSVNTSTKKRKLESPGECKTPKIVKITNKQNAVKDSDEEDKDSSVIESLNCSGDSVELIDIIEEGKQSKRPTNKDKAKRNVDKKESESHKLNHDEAKKNNVEEEEEEKDEVRRNNVKSRKSGLSKIKKKESQSPNTVLTKFLKKAETKQTTSKSMDNSIQEDKGEEDAESCDVSVIEDINENCDKNSVKVDDDILELKTDIQEKSFNANSPQNDKTSCADSDSDVTVTSSDNEDDNEKEATNKTTQDTNGSSPRTPKRTSLENASILKNKKLTPKILQKQMESAKKREERERLRMEKERKLEEKRENRRKEKEAEKEQKRKEKEQRELKKQMEMEQKQKEKEAKEQERRKREEAKEEEKRKKEEERLEAERKKQKAASNFASFFVAKKQEIKASDDENNMEVQTFMPFEVKADMRVAPITRRSLQEQEKLSLDEKCNSGSTERKDLYLAEIREKKVVTRKSGHTWPLEAKDDVILLEEEENDDNANVVVQTPAVTDKNRAKLLQFHENRRPPYWGTWRKRSKTINPRRPFSKDSVSDVFLIVYFIF
ncbi:hypothetical protein KPH14_003064 [Odynerus spinipes]|uniref:Chromatin assembly factor 1 subunit A n=1 Tax=Odynerus spinipes TaxID=1348599 RepID=A0AAD9RWS1_9HYME|nr:hypothetical protein KPH14_003064 [Odynerus spinipes]